MNHLKFAATEKSARAEPDSTVTLKELPDENPGIRIDAGSSGFLRFGGKCTAFSFDVDARKEGNRVYKLPKHATHFTTCGGPIFYTIGTAEWVS